MMLQNLFAFMKRYICLLLTVLFCYSSIHAETAIEVRRFSQWAHEYLTVTNNWNGLCANVTNGELPPCLSVIISVNGQSTKDMSVSEFDQILSTSNVCRLEYIEKIEGENKRKSCSFMPKTDYYLDIAKTKPLSKPNTINIVSDSDIDFFNYDTFDYIAEGDDKLTDKEIFESLGVIFESRGLRRSKENPDIVFKMTKRFMQNSNSTYVPEHSQIFNAGGSAYTWVDKKGNVHTNVTQYQGVHREGGYTKTTNTSELHVVLTAYDGKMYRDNPDSQSCIWKLDFNRFYQDFVDMMSVVKSDVGYFCNSFPFNTPVFAYEAKTSGVAFKSKEDIRTGKIIDVLEGSDAWNRGLRAGCTVEKVYQGGYYQIIFYKSRVTIFKKNSTNEKFLNYVMPACYVIIPIPIPFTSDAQPYDYLTNPRRYGREVFGSSKINYVCRDENGNKFKFKYKYYESMGLLK